ncbi:transmembrane protein 70 homolog, mitochondrial [Drosophila albomicans]|uniref:Transmembrane protein 70 homolog, mitochondrial n=1 Tax=Drosophila albomicans TaxID=7291 RepID=A0A6P8WYE3_DROAB|nr:transmembrane protein 70 homolog, mitochondrial [Drosophila albomicans]
MLTIRAALPCAKQFAAVLANTARTHTRYAAFLQPQVQLKQQNQHKIRLYATQQPTPSAKNAETTLQRVYYGSLAPRMKLVKLFSLTTSFAGIAAQPILMEQGLKIGGTGMAVLLCTVGGFFTFVTPLLLHFVTKKYVTELHYNQATDEYTATTISLILTKIQTTFRPSDVVVPEVPGMFTSFTVNKRPLFVDPALFDDPEHYVRIMGYDKPIDFKLNVPAEPEQSKKK